jgi:radical SAM superfamily enzyme YgiQ (UPF0313 family)
MSKIVFVNPALSAIERYGVLAQAGGVEPPFGLCYLASAVIRNGYAACIIDAQALNKSYRETTDLVLRQRPRYAAITAVSASINNAAAIAEGIKKSDPGIITILGGPHLSSLPVETMQMFPEFDLGVFGEGEETLSILLGHLEKGRSLETVNGLVIRKNGGVFMTGKRALIKDLDMLAAPSFGLLPRISRYYRVPAQSVNRLPAVSLVTSRGCMGKCTFCDRSTFGNYCRAHSAEYVMSLIRDLYYNYGIRSIMFEDDNFTFFRQRLLKLLKLLNNEKLDLTWSCSARIDTVDAALLKEMKKGGCWQVLYGIESGSQKILDFFNKNIKLEQVKDVLRITRGAGMSTKGFFILGNPLETKESLQETISFIKSADLDDISLTFFTPYPGSEVYPDIEHYGRLEKDWKKMNQFEIVFKPWGLTKKELLFFSRKTYLLFYLRIKTLVSYLKRIKNFPQFKVLFLSGVALIRYILTRKKDSNEADNN